MKLMSPTRHIAVFLLALAGTFLAGSLAAQELPGSEVDPGLAGTEYYIAFPQSAEASGSAHPKFLGVVISSQFATEVAILAPGRAPVSFETVPGQAHSIELDRSLEFTTEESEQITRKGVRITSRAPISVYVLNARTLSTGGYPALPITRWGTGYQTLTLPNHLNDRVGQIVLVAAYDSTRVTIRPSTGTYGTAAGHEKTRYLNRGETFSMLAYPSPDQVGIADLSASQIESTKPVGVISAHVRTAIRIDDAVSHLDYATSQAAMILPEESFGNTYLSIPFRPGGQSDRFRLMTTSNGTHLTMTHYPAEGGMDQAQIVLDRGEYIDITTIAGRAITGPVHWQASGRMLLMQLRTSGPFAGNDPKNAPAMVALTAIRHFGTRSVFSAPEQIDLASFTHTLTLIAKGPDNVSPDDPANPLRSLLLNGRPVQEIAPGILTQNIGTTGFYHVTLNVPAGGHMISSAAGYPFTGIISGENGTIGRDAYFSALPYWLPEIAADVVPPYLMQKQDLSKGNILVEISDRTDSYFSGVRDVRATAASSGWKQDVFSAPSPDVNATTKFRAIADPSGPLDIAVVDREGNSTTIRVHDGLCYKTAVADRSSIHIEANVGTGIFSERVALQTNSCGNSASVAGIDLGSGNASGHLDIEGGTGGFVIPPGDSKTIVMTVRAGTPAGTYTTIMRMKVDDSTISIPVELVVDGSSSVPADLHTLEIAGFYPNPFTSSTTLRLAHPLDRGTTLTISDNLGRVVRILGSDELLGRSEVTWNGDDAAGRALPAGLYLVTVDRQGARNARAVTLVR